MLWLSMAVGLLRNNNEVMFSINDNRYLLLRMQEALAKDPELAHCMDNIYFLVNDGAVIMGGSVEREHLKRQAKKIISTVPGVSLLIDDLKVESTVPQRMDVQIAWAGDIRMK